jgi:hypothetical protein
MGLRAAAMAAAISLISRPADPARAATPRSSDDQEHTSPIVAASSEQTAPPAIRQNDLPITVRPGTLALLADTLAGRSIRVASARVVGVFDPRVFLVDTQTRLFPIRDRDRVLVFIEAGALRVDPTVLVASTVTLTGVARTLLGMQVSREVPWPAALTPDAVKRLEIRAAVLATSVRTPEGVDLLTRSSSDRGSDR